MKSISIILLACLALWLGAVPALGQQPPTISSLNLSLWPEYDRPGLLVIYRGQFDPGVSVPLPVEFRIPASAGQPSAVAYLDEQGQLLQQQYTTRAEDGRTVVSFQLPTRGFQLEYYIPLNTSSETGQRTMVFTYTADYPVTAVNLDVQEPRGAQGFLLSPPAGSSETQADGLNYHLAQVGPLAQFATAAWTISYQKTSAGLTIPASQSGSAPSDASGASAPTPAVARSSPGVVILLGGLAMIAVGAGAFWLGKRGRPAPQPAAIRPRSRSHGSESSRSGAAGRQQPRAAAGGADQAFCHQCGTRLRPGSDFCHQCGAAVRKPVAR